ncbi:MAG: ester cyclase [Lachnospiraceae bacterium]|nr:ester cyclase [Lachnospiraceae bacterium]
MNDKELVTRFFVEGYTNKNYEFIMECLAEDYFDHSPAAARSNADAVEILKIVAGQFSELKVEMADIFAENGMVATRVLYDGIHTGTCMGIPATGKKIRFEALENFKVTDGKITESWGYWPDKQIEQLLRGEVATEVEQQ